MRTQNHALYDRKEHDRCVRGCFDETHMNFDRASCLALSTIDRLGGGVSVAGHDLMQSITLLNVKILARAYTNTHTQIKVH